MVDRGSARRRQFAGALPVSGAADRDVLEGAEVGEPDGLASAGSASGSTYWDGMFDAGVIGDVADLNDEASSEAGPRCLAKAQGRKERKTRSGFTARCCVACFRNLSFF